MVTYIERDLHIDQSRRQSDSPLTHHSVKVAPVSKVHSEVASQKKSAHRDLSTQMVAAGQVVKTGSWLLVTVDWGELFMMLRIVITSSGLKC